MSNESQYPNDIQFAGLVQAATDAAGQEERWSNHGDPTLYRQSDKTSGGLSSFPDPATASLTAAAHDGPRKRKRGGSDELPQGQYIPVGHPADANNPTVPYETRPEDAAARDGVASALFREPSEKSRRYTRPPMSSLYSSLQLAPENFLRLQAAAKDYMLDENFPDRQDCVGQRGAGDNSDMVKLRLWNCVQEFLDQHGHGERYWGHHAGSATDQASRTLFWPEDCQKIVKLCVPLLRRMVTNERQRRYAAMARKSGEKIQTPGRHDAHEDSSLTMRGSSPVPASHAQAAQVPDMLGEGSTPSVYEVELWDSDHNQQELQRLRQGLPTDEAAFRGIVANVDGHLEIFHQGDLTSCNPECEEKSIGRLLEWLHGQTWSSNGPRGENATGIFHNLFEICRVDSENRHLRASLAATDGVQSQPIPSSAPVSAHATQATLARTSKRTAKGPAPLVNRQPDGAMNASRNNLTILVNVISNEASSSSASSGSRRIIPRFSLAPESATNLASLRAEVQQRYRHARAVSPSTAMGDIEGSSVKVWLPDGLVQVKDDGEWMIALLSAGMVEWMDGEVRIVMEA